MCNVETLANIHLLDINPRIKIDMQESIVRAYCGGFEASIKIKGKSRAKAMGDAIKECARLMSEKK